MLWPTLYCYFASFTVERIASVGNDVYFLKWYYYPPMLQKYFTLIISRSQGKVQFAGFGLIYCSIETFGKVRIVWCPGIPFFFSDDKRSKVFVFIWRMCIVYSTFIFLTCQETSISFYAHTPWRWKAVPFYHIHLFLSTRNIDVHLFFLSSSSNHLAPITYCLEVWIKCRRMKSSGLTYEDIPNGYVGHYKYKVIN